MSAQLVLAPFLQNDILPLRLGSILSIFQGCTESVASKNYTWSPCESRVDSAVGTRKLILLMRTGFRNTLWTVDIGQWTPLDKRRKGLHIGEVAFTAKNVKRRKENRGGEGTQDKAVSDTRLNVSVPEERMRHKVEKERE
ncbi:hypothetical protein RRG08_042677 [Elysia crispata]|uniref:Uncharacterized protein n=1 Tax=Elysia crispata TaxID=231223 RepID=A0AAE0XQ13_9GAST|nr:hypothetical protein RRG08_042677 [Elysia crispata]